jgi:RNA polymerase sigma-70 factor (ECF subfamily)
VAADHEFRRRLFAAIDELPQKLRLAIVLSAMEGFNTGEVSTLLGVPEGTVKSRLHSARKLLLERLR